MALRLNGATSGFVELNAPATAGSNTLTLPDGNGTSGQYLQTNGSGGLSWQTVASLSNAEDGSGTDFEFNSGFGSNATAYGCRAYVNFSGATPSIRSSGNVSSVTKNTAGDYTINFTNAMPDVNYTTAFGGGSQTSGTSYYAMEQHDSQVRTTSAVRIYTLYGAGTPFDAGIVCVHIFR